MTAYTHVAFASSIAILFGYVDFKSIFIIALSSLIPDIDTKHSMVTKLFYPIWKILNLLGVQHRTYTHSIFIYLALGIIGVKLNIDAIYFISIGGMTHIFLDCLNKSGVPLFLPVTDKICVFTSRKYRLSSGSKLEIYFIITFVLFGYSFYNININGGFRAYLLKYLNNYQFTYNQYLNNSENVNYLEAKVRSRESQRVEEKRYLVVCATNRSKELYLWDEEEEVLVSTLEDVEVLKGSLVTTQSRWNYIYLDKIFTLKESKGLVFQKTNKNVKRVRNGEYLVKNIFYLEDLQLE